MDTEHHPFAEQPGHQSDLAFCSPQATWLHDSEVKLRILPERGRWVIYLVFIWIEHPLQVLMRRIRSVATEREADLMGKLLVRTARRDGRGTLQTRNDALHICDN
jgi:hypothetical protein